MRASGHGVVVPLLWLELRLRVVAVEARKALMCLLIRVGAR